MRYDGYGLRDPHRPTLLILGGSGHASDVLSIIEDVDSNQLFPFDVVVADDNLPDLRRFDGRRADVAFAIDAELKADRYYVAGVGYPDTRRLLVSRAEAESVQASPPIIHPSVVMATGATAGVGTVIAGLTWVSAAVAVGDHVYVGYGVKVGHDTVVGDYTSLMPGVAIGGSCSIGEGAMIGANATVLQNLTIGDGAVIGAGAVVLHDVPAGATVVGVPARVVHQS